MSNEVVEKIIEFSFEEWKCIEEYMALNNIKDYSVAIKELIDFGLEYCEDKTVNSKKTRHPRS